MDDESTRQGSRADAATRRTTTLATDHFRRPLTPEELATMAHRPPRDAGR